MVGGAGQITVIACVLELCWNFEPFVLARTTTYRYEAKTHSRHVIGADFGPLDTICLKNTENQNKTYIFALTTFSRARMRTVGRAGLKI